MDDHTSTKKNQGIFAGIRKNVLTLGVASFFTDISSEMLYPIIPIFLTTVLGAPMSVLGLIEGVAEAAASILKAISGWYSDVIKKRRPFVVGGYFLSAMGKLVYFFAYSWPAILLARLVDRIGKGVRTSPRDAMLADSCQPQYRGKAFGFHRAMDTAGACLGPLAALWLLYALKEDLRMVFLIAFVPAVLAVFMLAYFLKEVPANTAAGRPSKRIDLRRMSPEFWKILAVSTLFSAGNSSDAFLVMRSKDIGLSTAAVILAYVLYNVSYSALSMPAGIISDKIPRKLVMIGGYIIFAFVYVGFGLFANRLTVWPLFFVYGFYIAMTDGVSKALISDVTDEDVRGTAMGIYHCATGVGVLCASLVAGLLWTYMGAASPFLYGSIMALFAAVAFAAFIR